MSVWQPRLIRVLQRTYLKALLRFILRVGTWLNKLAILTKLLLLVRNELGIKMRVTPLRKMYSSLRWSSLLKQHCIHCKAYPQNWPTLLQNIVHTVTSHRSKVNPTLPPFRAFNSTPIKLLTNLQMSKSWTMKIKWSKWLRMMFWLCSSYLRFVVILYWVLVLLFIDYYYYS